MFMEDRFDKPAAPGLAAPRVNAHRARPDIFRPPIAEYVYPADGSRPYLLAEGNMYAEVIIQAILDAGVKLPKGKDGGESRLGTRYNDMCDAIEFLYGPDRRRYYIAAAAGIDEETLDLILKRLLEGEVNPYGRDRHLSAEGISRLRERVSHFVKRSQPATL